MKRKKILICCILAALLTILTIIPIFATNNVIDDYKIPPSDLGEEIPLNTYNEGYGKYYIRIDLSQTRDLTVQFRMFYSSYSTTVQSAIRIIIQNNHISITNMLNYDNNYCYIVIPILELDFTNELYLYVPAYAFNGIPFTGFNVSSVPEGLKYYYSTTNEETVIQREAFQIGYENGYYNGYDEGLLAGQNIQQYTNLVGYVEQLIGQFTGSSAAQYITPIAIVLVVLFVYFLFIRFLLSLVKAKGIIKTCDIIMIVACIIMLVVMYSPMLDFTIKTEQIYTSEEDTETVQVRNSNIYVVPTETGDIYYGPVGTAIVTKSETIEEVYKITKDIETEAIAYEKD